MDAIRLSPPRRLSLPVENQWGAGEMSVLDFGDPKRPVDLIFVHANGFNAMTYRSLLAPLSGSLRIWAPDLRGHGLSRLPAEPDGRRNWYDHRDDLIALLDTLDGPPAVLAGHSMGGTSALLAAAERPDRVSKLVLMDPVIWGRLTVLAFQLPLLERMAHRIPLVKNARRRRALFDSREQAMAAYSGRGAFRGWPELMLADYLADGLVETADGLALACPPDWEASNYAAQGHNPWRALKRLDRPVRILKAEAGSTCHLSPNPRGLPLVAVEAVEGGTHFFPMLKADVARDALFDAAV
ncbi:pimeloyl-ACP methyl ester carboxylesterase [Brevundimonas alba]|uniref:Pimeloyl-ACP methyl ester carboxylesterase n=1 Tax=Brevundimonas alba TaxID=74314 RepID=A0A7X5YJU8_9CAUL|nr:alpha/beta hydrolase [Brevundimonas alba]NJC40922.1 pimeloyl-ACP methyl ester carboxylesterase [Brevundimonas alba]